MYLLLFDRSYKA